LPEVVRIGEGAFWGCAGLVAISLPKAESLGKWTFQSCRNLTTANLPKAVSLGDSTFGNCSSLTTINLPEAVSIGDSWTFFECSSLTTVTLPKISSLGDQTFNGCASLAVITLGAKPPAVPDLEYNARIFLGAATTAKTITFKAPDVAVYTAAGSPWSDKMGLNTDVGDYWDDREATKGNLTVALAAIDG
jgi:hypothetical protein